ncbi:MAG: hypothetical protein ACO3ND_00880 [Opitutales bacterium]
MSQLLLAALLVAAQTPTEDRTPREPASLPIIYDQPGDRFILRIDSRRYQLHKDFRPSVAELMAAANYPRTKLAHQELVMAVQELDKALERAASARRDAERDAARSRRHADTVESLNRQIALVRATQPVDFNAIAILLNQIAVESESLRRAQLQEDKSRGRAAAPDRAADPARLRADKAREAYVRALDDYERPLSRIRAIAIANGSAL